MSQRMDISDLHQTFFDEADELLDDMERLLVKLDLGAPADEDLNAIFRAAHSIKGGAGTFGFTCLQNTTHLLENLLDRARHHSLTLDRAMVDMFLETRDILKGQLDSYRSESQPDAEAFDRICQALKELAESSGDEIAAPEKSVATAEVAAVLGDEAEGDAAARSNELQITVRDVDDKERDVLIEELGLFGKVLDHGFADHVLKARLAASAAADEIEAVLCFVVDADQLTIMSAEQLDTAAPAAESAAEAAAGTTPNTTSATPAVDAPANAVVPAPAQAKRKGSQSSEPNSLRVGTDKVDRIINLVGELVITQSMLEQIGAGLETGTSGALTDSLNQLQRNARELQDAVMSMRMVPVGQVFSRFPRLVRDLGRTLGKEIELKMSGESTELDKSLVEKIIDPMTHLVRNSVDHGIEKPDVREGVGKQRSGTLTLAAEHQGGNILIEIRDDGAGLDRERILNKAREQGIEIPDPMDDNDVWQLILAPGFSTAEAVTDVSGRGVGMDVVKRNIEQLGGHIDLRSEYGQGTTVRIYLPLTLAILDGMSVRVGSDVFILPLGVIVESMQVDSAKLKMIAGSDQRLLYVRGSYLKLVELHRVFNIDNAQTDVGNGIVMVVQSEGHRFALLVDELVGEQQVVVKNLETNYRKVAGISAATILGDGSVALILDAAGLYRSSLAQQPSLSLVRECTA